MSDVIDSEGYRANVGIVLMRDSGQVFLGRRVGGRGWQFPQGGMHMGEGVQEAALRELQEEVGLLPDDVEPIGTTADWLRYRLPPRYQRHHQQPLCIGQKQRWLLMRVRSAEARFDLAHSAQPEFDRWRWADYWEPVREVIYFKRPVYVRALQELAPAAFPDGVPQFPPWWGEITASADNALRRAARRSKRS